MKALKYFISSLMLVSLLAMTSCGEDKLGDTIFPEIDETLDPNSYSYQLDKFLRENYLKVYNLDFKYKMEDVGTDMNYNLVPATYKNSVDLAVLTKYLWFDAYKAVAGEDFLKRYGPRIIHLIGSPAYNPNSGNMILGLAEGGIKVSLFRVNEMNVNNFEIMNEYYFKTMHHEFSHILHQMKTYPNEFNRLSVGHYDSNNWQDKQDGVVNSQGFVTTYASSEFREDFAETIANFIVKTDAQWARILELASRGWTTADGEDSNTAVYYCYYYYSNNEADPDKINYISEWDVRWADDDPDHTGQKYYRTATDSNGNRILVYDVEDKDGIDGAAIILQKVQIARDWLQEAWGVSLDEIRKEVQKRQADYDMDELRKQVYEIQ